MTVADLRPTRTGGREATTRHIPPRLALSVGLPSTPPPPGWRWSALTDLARLESGHTPSRRHPEYWGGSIPWLSIQDAKAHHGGRIGDTVEHVTEAGIENSSARVLPANTVCLSRTASVGYVVVMDRPMATSQDFVNWVCGPDLDPDFLKYLFLAEGDGLLRFASGAVHQTIYFPEAKGFYVSHPPLDDQRRISRSLDGSRAQLQGAQQASAQNAAWARALFVTRLSELVSNRGKGWQEVAIGDIAEHSLGKMLDGQKNKGDLQPYLRNINVRWFGFDLADIKQMRFLPQEHERYSIRKGDVLVCEGGYPGRAAIWQSDRSVFFQKALHRVRFRDALHAQWFVWYLYAEDKSDRLRQHFSGTGIQHFTGEALHAFRLPVPPDLVLADLVGKLKRLVVETARLETQYLSKSEVLEELQRSLLNQAFTGAV